jgi:hypothetical protein
MSIVDAPYTRDEMRRVIDESPERGPVCPKCGAHIPQFAELKDDDASRVRSLILSGQKMMATQELRFLTGCPISWAKLWVEHSGRPDSFGTTAPCPYCGKPLVTARAQQCHHCFMDWHDPQRPRSLKKQKQGEPAS